MEQSSGEIGAGGAKQSDDAAAAGDSKDRLSTLPDETLVLILLCLDTTAAGRTSALFRRWRRVWTLLPELRFSSTPAPHLIAAALEAHEAPLRHLFLGLQHGAAEPVADCLRAAARCLSGELIVKNERTASEVSVDEEDGAKDAFELPCFESATTVSLDLGFLRVG